MRWYFEVLKKYAVFSGRARRKEYWMYFLVNVIIAVILIFLDRATGLTGNSGIGLGPLYGLYTLVCLIPSIAVAVRRLHDTNRSAWWLLLALVPLAALVLLVFACQDSERGENRYGPNPKAAAA